MMQGMYWPMSPEKLLAISYDHEVSCSVFYIFLSVTYYQFLDLLFVPEEGIFNMRHFQKTSRASINSPHLILIKLINIYGNICIQSEIISFNF